MKMKSSRGILYGITAIILLGGLYLTSLYNYLLFHSLAELTSIIIAVGIFMVAWHSRRFTHYSYLLLLGFAYLSIGSIDLLHTLTYKGMGVFPSITSANIPTQLWIQARFLEAFSLLAATFFAARTVRSGILAACYGLLTVVVIAVTFFTDIFPVCYIEGVGLTLFKRSSEYVICGILLIAGIMYIRKRKVLQPGILKYMIGSIALMIASELAFTRYLSVYGPANLIGHLLKVLSFFLIYRAVVSSGLTKPYMAQMRSEARTKSLIEGSPNSICIRDLETRLVTWNDVYASGVKALLGVNVKTGMRLEDVVPKEMLAEYSTVRELMIRALEGETQQADFDVPYPDGSKRYFHIDWTPIREDARTTGVVEVTRDVTEITRARNMYRSLVENSNEAILVIQDDKARYCNPQAIKLSGYTEDEILSKPFIEFIHPDDHDQVLKEYMERISGENLSERYPIRMVTRDGEARWVLVNSVLIDWEGRPASLTMVTDISEQRSAERNAREQRDSLARINRFLSMTQLAGSIAHELTQPLTGILSNSQAALMLLERDELCTEELGETLSDIVSDTRRAADIIRNMRAFHAKLQSGIKEYDINVILRDTLKLLHSEFIQQQISVVENLSDNRLPVHVNRIQLQQVIVNLMINACQAMSTSEGNSRQLTVSSGVDRDGEVLVSVDDTGPGVRTEDLTRIFEPLSTSKLEGTGMGLPICRSIVESYDGIIWAENRPEGGARFCFTIPSMEEK